MNRSNFIIAALCLATFGAGQWLAGAQQKPPPTTAGAPALRGSIPFPDCTGCPWQYKAMTVTAQNVEFEVLPPGTVGFLHGIWIDGERITLSDGPLSPETRIGTFTSRDNASFLNSLFIELNVRFVNGLHFKGGFENVTFLYRLE